MTFFYGELGKSLKAFRFFYKMGSENQNKQQIMCLLILISGFSLPKIFYSQVFVLSGIIKEKKERTKIFISYQCECNNKYSGFI